MGEAAGDGVARITDVAKAMFTAVVAVYINHVYLSTQTQYNKINS